MNELARQDVWAAETTLRDYPQTPIPLKHYFTPGVYAREMTAPAGTLIIGQLHKYTQLNILSKGVADLIVDGIVYRIEAPFTYIAPPGTKRMFFTWTDLVWTTILGTDLQDIQEIEDYFVAKTEQEYLTFVKETQLCLS